MQRVHQLDTDLKELLDRNPDLENASGAMPGTYSIKIDPTAKPVVHGPRRQPAALLPKIVDKLKEMEKRTPSQSDATNGLSELHSCLKPRRKDQDLPRPGGPEQSNSQTRTLPDTYGRRNCSQDT